MKRVELTPGHIRRFWAKVDTSGECWLWTASTMNTGYGQFSVIVDGKKTMGLAHRVSFQIHHGRTPEMYVDHRCHNKLCVNPDHLREVTNKQNSEHLISAYSNSKSGVRGVRWHAECRKWQVEVTHNYKHYYLGVYASLDEAKAVAVAKRIELFTHNDHDRQFFAERRL